MKLYSKKVPDVAKAIIETLCNESAIDVDVTNRSEAEQDLVSIMNEYLRRDNALRNNVREVMANEAIAFQNYGKVRSRVAEEWNHPLGEDVEKFLARQFIENFMISRFVDEVYAEDGVLWRRLLELLRSFDVDENALRDEARAQIKNLEEGTVDFEVAMEKALRDVKKRKGLV